MPLALLLSDWNGWRAWTPSFDLAFPIPALLGTASPWLAEFAFQGSRALQVWYGDSTLT